MKPQFRSEMIRQEWWDCGLQHKHQREATAQRCIDRRNRPKRPTRTWRPEDYRAVARLRAAGKSIKELAAIFGLSRERVRFVAAKGARLIRIEEKTTRRLDNDALRKDHQA